jgi:integral membrane sensor domain MASE1
MQPYQTRFSKAILTGLFVGIFATLICLAYNIYYRETTSFPLASLINVSSLIFAVNLLFLVVGLVYYACIKTFKKGDLVFIVLFVLLTIFFTWKGDQVYRTDNHILNMEFHHLLVPMILIMGISAIVGIPLLFHSRKFEENVL